jgi:hypothetical protein
MKVISRETVSIPLLIILFAYIVSSIAGSEANTTIRSIGSIDYRSHANVFINSSNVVGTNKLALGSNLDWEWKDFCDSAVRRQLAKEANLKLIRIFDWRYQAGGSPDPCIYWNESSQTGTFDWTSVDLLVQRIFEIGAEPLFCLGRYSSTFTKYYPTGMAVNPLTDLPYSQSFAAYAKEWVRHFRATGKPVRFYEIFNEPFSYFGWSADYTKLGYFKDLWNACARAMRSENSGLMISFDFTTARRVLDYWVQYGDDLNYLDAHKYDCESVPGYDDAEVFKRAEERRFLSSPDTTFYGFNDAQQIWLNARGKMLPTVISESNVNSGYQGGTDPRMAQMAGAVRTALVLRMGVLTDLNYHVYYEYSNNASYDQSIGIGYGFGMINSNNNHPWYSYYAQKLVGENLGINDPILETSCDSDALRVLAWYNGSGLNILMICKLNETRIARLSGVTGLLNASWIDNTIPFTNALLQNKIVDAGAPLEFNGYTVMLLKTYLP